MREGVNPYKTSGDLQPYARHRIIVPVYIPNLAGYFQHAVEILKLCLDSLDATTTGRASITVISNGCTESVVAFLRSYLEERRIHQLILNDRNWGKIDASLSALRGRFEEMLTIADADVLFVPGWLDEIEAIFRTFPECGFATPSPNPSLAFLHTSSTILSAAASRELSFERVVPDQDLDRFAQSIGRPDLFRPQERQVQMIVQRRGVTACVGGGHYVFTLRRELAWRLPRQPSLTALRPFGETAWFDDPPDAMGLWRLSTSRAYAYHMGNVPEPWMYEELTRAAASTVTEQRALVALPPLKGSRFAMLPFSWRRMGIKVTRRLHFERQWAKAAARVGVQHA